MTRMQKQCLRILIKLLVLAPLLSSLDPTGWTPISAFLAQNSALELWVDISSNNCLGSWLWSWEGLLAQSSCLWEGLLGQAETLLAGPELGLHLERVLCRLAPVQPRRSWAWAVGGREEGRPPPRLAAHKPFHPPSGSRLPFPPAQPCCNCIPGIALRGPPPPVGAELRRGMGDPHSWH